MRTIAAIISALSIASCALPTTEDEPDALLAIQAGVGDAPCVEANLITPNGCALIEGNFEVYSSTSCTLWPGRYKCLSTATPVYVVGQGSVREVPLVNGVCEACKSDYIAGNVTAKYW